MQHDAIPVQRPPNPSSFNFTPEFSPASPTPTTEVNATGIKPNDNASKLDDHVQPLHTTQATEVEILDSALDKIESKQENIGDKAHFIQTIANQIQVTGSKSSPTVNFSPWFQRTLHTRRSATHP